MTYQRHDRVYVTLDSKRQGLRAMVTEVCESKDPDGAYWVRIAMAPAQPSGGMTYYVSGRQLYPRPS